jgi:hypothetical protein
VVDDVRVLRLLRAVTDDLHLLRQEAGAGDARRADPLWLRGVKYTFVTSIEVCIDIAQHICSAQGRGPPADNGDAMKALGCHLPPGTSKWNKIEHRLFSAISRNWRARPLESHEVVIETLRATTTSTGLTVNAVLDTTTYDRGIKITDKQIAALEATQLHRHKFHGDWNYTLTADRAATRPT